MEQIFFPQSKEAIFYPYIYSALDMFRSSKFIKITKSCKIIQCNISVGCTFMVSNIADLETNYLYSFSYKKLLRTYFAQNLLFSLF